MLRKGNTTRTVYLLTLALSVAIVTSSYAGEDDCVSQLINNTTGNLTVPPETCTTWEFPSLGNNQLLFVKLEDIEVVYPIPQFGINLYCAVDIIIAGNNYCYFQPGVCFIAGLNLSSYFLPHVDLTENCSNIIWLTSSNLTMIYRVRREDKDPKFRFSYNIIQTAEPETETLHVPLITEPTEFETTTESETEHGQTQSQVEVGVIVVLGVLFLVILIILLILLFRIHQKGLLKRVIGSEPFNSKEDNEAKSEQPHDDAITVYSAIQRPSRDFVLPMSSEHKIVVNELHSM